MERTFLGPEIEALTKVVRSKSSWCRSSSAGVNGRCAAPGWPWMRHTTRAVELAAMSPTTSLAVHGARSTLIAEDLVRRRQLLANPVAMKRLVAFAGRAHHAHQWASRMLDGVPRDTRVVFYTYWWGPTTTGFGFARKGRDNVRVVSRAHGFDLYEDRHTPAYIPCRERSLSVLDALFPDSDKGGEYLMERFGRALPTCETARLGMKSPGAVCRASDDGVLRVVSCSLQVPVKRLHLLISGLAAAGRRQATRRIEWTHFGTGALQPELEAQAAREFPTNMKATFGGYSTQPELLRWYAGNPVDVFVNVSASEGTPVAVMEAIAFGIPVLATAVGGNPEIATPENGVQLSPNPSADEVAAGLLRFTEQSTQEQFRRGSLEVWRRKYDADANLEAFARRLITL
jgi:glycosyltransferase involved in cell wall biosynthesis